MRHRKLLLSLASILAGGSALGPASAQQAAAPQAGEVASLAGLPSDIRTVIGPDVADRGGPFAAGCVSPNGEPHSRFAGAHMSADMAQVRMEYGGIAHYFDTLEFRQLNGRWVHVPKQPGQKAPSQALDK
jgi:hypothetical protein